MSPHLGEDQFHQLIQKLFSSDPGIECAGYVVYIWVKGARGGAQVTEELWDRVRQRSLTVIVFTVIIISGILLKQIEKRNTNVKN